MRRSVRYDDDDDQPRERHHCLSGVLQSRQAGRRVGAHLHQRHPGSSCSTPATSTTPTSTGHGCPSGSAGTSAARPSAARTWPPSRQPAAADAEPRTGRARLSYRRAAEVFRTASGGWTLHQLRHSRLTHLAEAGVPDRCSWPKSRHGSVMTLNLYAKPAFDRRGRGHGPLGPCPAPRSAPLGRLEPVASGVVA